MENSCYILRKKESDANKNSQIFAIFIMCSMTLSIINWIFYAYCACVAISFTRHSTSHSKEVIFASDVSTIQYTCLIYYSLGCEMWTE